MLGGFGLGFGRGLGRGAFCRGLGLLGRGVVDRDGLDDVLVVFDGVAVFVVAAEAHEVAGVLVVEFGDGALCVVDEGEVAHHAGDNVGARGEGRDDDRDEDGPLHRVLVDEGVHVRVCRLNRGVT